MDETRGTLFFNIASIIKAHHPKVVLLENVRNLVGPRHEHEWEVIIETLRDEGYHVSDEPAVFSPHLLPPRSAAARRSASGSSSPRPTHPRRVPTILSSAALPRRTMSDRFPRPTLDSCGTRAPSRR